LGAPTYDQLVAPTKIVSFKKMLKEEHPHLGGMARIDGYVANIVDPFRNIENTRKARKEAMDKIDLSDWDVFLCGRAEPNQPELRFDDLIVAIRSVRGDYNREEAGVSLDPSPNPQLREDLKKALANGNKDNFRSYDAVCKELMNYPTIYGMPQKCQAAKTLLDADYRMKLVASGEVKLPIKNFKSTIDFETDMYSAAIKATNVWPDNIPVSTIRNWFTAGEIHYLPDEGPDGKSSFIACAQVVLKSERKEGGDQNDTPDKKFTCAWNSRMQEILQSELIWKQMNGIFRHFALAKALHEDNALNALPYDSVRIMDFKVPSVDIPSQYPVSTSSHKEQSVKINGKDWRWANFHCGGVSLAGKIVKSQLLMKSDSVRSDMRLIRERVLASARSSGGAAHWDIR
jgi:hypothetical protein